VKNFLKYTLFIVSVLFSTAVLSNEKIYFIDIDFIIKNSLAGKSLKEQLSKLNKSYSDAFKKEEAELIKDEKKLITQKNILAKNEFDNKINLFKKKITKFKGNRKANLKNLSKMRKQARQKLINSLSPIITEYSQKNSISFILSKQNIIIGKNELDLTNNIIKIFDSKVKTIKLK
tara:strand:- start:616 stop:1140 length:525 start_codon:yes stop_codon:yes gene_type:complete